jgi:hypothetical protein
MRRRSGRKTRRAARYATRSCWWVIRRVWKKKGRKLYGAKKVWRQLKREGIGGGPGARWSG